MSAEDASNRVQVAAHHWRPRFVANGIDVNDFDDTVARTVDWKDWGPNWRAVGRIHEALGTEARSLDRPISAAQAFQRAAWCYHLGKFLWFEDVEMHAELRDTCVAPAVRGAHRSCSSCPGWIPQRRSCSPSRKRFSGAGWRR